MKIAIVNNCVPFLQGGAEALAESLRQRLREYGHQAMITRLPFRWHPAESILESMLSCRLMRFEGMDRVIGLKFPAYYVRHPNKVLWILHQFRSAYDVWGTPLQDIPATPDGVAVREAIMRADNQFLPEAKKIYTISGVVTHRLRQYNQIASEPLYPPLMETEKYYCGAQGDYFFFPSRLNQAKRQYLAIEAMQYTRSQVRLVIAGSPDTPQDLERLETLVKKLNLQGKVKILGTWITDEEKRKLLAESLGVMFLPFNEDYGYVTLEAFYSKKPLITCTDSGGPLEFAVNGHTGSTVLPEARALAEAMDALYAGKAQAKKMGQAGYERVLSMNINWENTIRRLTA